MKCDETFHAFCQRIFRFLCFLLFLCFFLLLVFEILFLLDYWFLSHTLTIYPYQLVYRLSFLCGKHCLRLF